MARRVSIISRSRKHVLDAIALRQDGRQCICRLNFRERLIMISFGAETAGFFEKTSKPMRSVVLLPFNHSPDEGCTSNIL